MHAYPPWHRVVAWDWLVPQVLVLAVVIVALAIYICNTRTGRQRLVHLVLGIGIVVGAWLLLIPNIATGREAARRTQCKHNLKVIAAAVLRNHAENGRLPPPYVTSADSPATSWRVDLLPLLADVFPKSRDTAAGYDRTYAWDATTNMPPARSPAQPYPCPSNRTPYDAQRRWYTAYALLTGPGTAFPQAGPLTMNDIADGTSNTLLVVEACGRNIVWTEPRDVNVSRETFEINAPGTQPGTSDGVGSSYHAGGAQAALADGSVRFLSQQISPDVLRALATAAAGDPVGEF